ncbi:response regulator [Paenibacillus sediminis]|uniref:Two-component system response regulator YesN n=1 Tax=Paenibacillus sediminis TaxID=664909 RepID=A0ABS4H7N5_9BACL|nr:response regulator [Paenibacillus sediminis]MBP1938534.1 two-component system response regulator YesN [Paenibacillus sediminis]
MRALIVDDEKHVRDAIRLLVDWDKHGIDEVLEAEDGIKAAEIVIESSPQIIMTDMRMPGQDGAQLLKWLHTNAPDSKVIVISGYDNFELVRHTIRYGGMDYILKPVEAEAVNEAIARAVTTWRSQEEERQRRFKQSIEMNQMKPLYHDKLLSELIMEDSAKDSVLTQLQAEFPYLKLAQSVTVAVMSTHQLDDAIVRKYEYNRELLFFTLINICNDFLKKQGKGIAFRHLERLDEIVILYWDDQDALNTALRNINEGITITLHRRMHFGVGSLHVFPNKAAASYHEARQSLWHRNLLHGDSYIHRDIRTETAQFKPLRLKAYQEKFRLAALSGSLDQMSSVLDEWMAQAKQLDFLTPEQLDQWNTEWDWLLEQWIEDGPLENEPEHESIIHSELTGWLPLGEDGLLSFPKWKEQWTKRLQAAGKMLTNVHGKENHVIFDIARYVERNYHEDISLQDIASRFYLSREYISRKFKQQFGVTLSDYLGNIRIEKAKVLLLNPQLRISQIAEMVGYQDEKYFSKVFKKIEGITPNDFRKQSHSLTQE